MEGMERRENLGIWESENVRMGKEPHKGQFEKVQGRKFLPGACYLLITAK
jgi:hypothetical protein